MAHVLIVHSDPAQRGLLRQALENHGYLVAESASTPVDPAACAVLGFERYQCIIADVDTPPPHTPLILDATPHTPVILISPRPDVRQAVAAIKAGACEYLACPCPEAELVAAVERCIAEQADRGRDADPASVYPIIGSSPAMQELMTRIAKVGPTDSTVIIRGESGTGKELIARAIHAASRRAHAPMISLNCASIPPRLIETELFGYSATAAHPERNRTGLLEAANGGTLFLDEIGELEPEAQARLLRVLQAGELRRFGAAETFHIDVRLITSTHRDLARLVANGQFREDLYYRLNVLPLEVPPLRERGDDILLVADFILMRARTRLSRESCQFGPDARQAMLRYHWPGNVRELENAIERAVILCDGSTISAEMLAIDTSRSPAREPAATAPDQTSLEDYFVSFVLANQDQLTETELADKLGISRKSLWERRQRLNIPRKRTRQRAPRRDEG
jgi:two-component system, NtrC family, response regulator HydG